MARSRTLLGAWLLATLVALPSLGPEALAQAPEPPLLGTLTPRGGVDWLGPPMGREPAVPKTVDGSIADWVGRSSMLGGTTVLDRGEMVYQDFLFDDRGADDGKDATRRGLAKPVEEAVPNTQRLEALSQALGAQFDLGPADPTGGILVGKEQYGDAAYPSGAAGHADLLEVRVAADAANVYLLARFATLTDPALPALLLLADTDGQAGPARDVPFDSGLRTQLADVAVLLTSDSAQVADLAGGAPQPMGGTRVAVNPEGYTNALEASVPRSLLAPHGVLKLALGAGIASGAGLAPVATGEGLGQVLNVAFRAEERVSVWMDHDQAMALLAGDLDVFFQEADLDALVRGASQAWLPTPGYHERVFRSAESISEEQGMEGIHQIYGLYLPPAWSPVAAAPLTVWLPWRGGSANTAAAWAPRLFEQLGEERGSIIVNPRARGPSSWFVGVGHQDFLEVWDDVHAAYRVDADRTYVAGLSMGGYGTYLMGLLYPDRFAAAFSIAGPVTQGAWLGVDEHGLDTVPTNDAEAAAQLLYGLVENAYNLPFLVFHNTADQVVPATGVERTALRFLDLGYRHRVVVFAGYEHHTTAIMDEWAEGARWFDAHVREAHPARVVYKRIPALERAVEQVYARNATLHFAWGESAWLHGMVVRDPDPDDLRSHGFADVRSLAIPEAHDTQPEAGGGAITDGHTAPHVAHGLAWVPEAPPPARNGFEATFRGVSEATLDLGSMGIDPRVPLAVAVNTDGPLRLRLRAAWAGAPSGLDWEDGAAVLRLPAGNHSLDLTPPLGAPLDLTSRATPALSVGLALVVLALAAVARRRR